ncbi:hypothetical protein G5714_022925 [Onychostoma macrolepis]|uniref:Ig-like domain-containing protein n=1 Tax=Onychostoma macrolepis TaxID=369639 RepID=A0A7J6BPX7_9TELE|nr:hypothetical protein G5714_022925 [Onychostoma macrolepis]
MSLLITARSAVPSLEGAQILEPSPGEAPIPQSIPGEALDPESSPGVAPMPQLNPGEALDPESSPGGAPVPKPSPGEAPVPKQSPGEAPVPQPSPGVAPMPQLSPGEASDPESSPGGAPVPQPSPGGASVPQPSPGVAPMRQSSPGGAPVPKPSPGVAPMPQSNPGEAPVPQPNPGGAPVPRPSPGGASVPQPSQGEAPLQMEGFKIFVLTVAVSVQVTSQDSTTEPPVQISKPKITLNLAHEVLYNTETVILRCEVSGEPPGLQYDWYKDSKDLDEHQPSITANDTGKYECKAKKGATESGKSDSYTLTLKDPPKAKLTVDPDWTEVFPGENISLQCSIQNVSENWNYIWFKNSSKIDSSGETNIKGNTLTLSVQSSHDGAYVCQAELQDRNVTTAKSTLYSLTVIDYTPKPEIRKHQWFEPFYTDERVQLHCNMSGVGWEYHWNKDSNPLITNPELTIDSVSVTDTGDYHCKAQRGDFSVDSETLQVRVQELPQPKLSIESQWNIFYLSEKVTLKCSIDEDSNKWGYEWFINGAQPPKNTDMSLSGNTLSISSAKSSHSGQYTCRGRHLTRTPVTTGQTEAVQLHIQEPPKPQIQSDWTEAFTGEKVSLQCLIKNVSGNWNYMWFKGQDKIVSSSEANIKGNTLTLSVQSGHGGAYVCQAELQDRNVTTAKSTPHSLTVKARPPAFLSLETELNDIMTGDMTLRCNVSDGRQWNYTWFMNGKQLNGSSDVIKVTGNEETVKSEFKCKGINTVRPLYSALSEGFIANNIIFKRKILLAISGCLVCCIVILIIGCIVLKITRKPGVNETAPEDLFFSMTDSKNQTASPMKEYMDSIPIELEECQEKDELITDHASAVHEDCVIKDEDTPASEANGLTSFKGL